MLPRRQLLRTGLLTAAGLATQPLWTPAASAQTMAPSPRRVARIAHLTDVHIQPEQAGDRGFAACLHHVQANAKPDLVLFGGDAVYDVSETAPTRNKLVADLWRNVLRADLSTPHRSAIGNHDIPQMKQLVADRASDDAAKSWACDLLGLDKRYFSFDQFGWHFVVLDSVRVGGPHGYAGRLDDEQFDWLEKDLAAAATAKQPTIVLSHIPIVTVVGFFDGDRVKSGDWDVPSSYIHIDANRLHELFVKSGNVKLCLSGHAHQFDRCLFDGVTYACSGAVCGNWWKGTYHHTPAGYAVIDLHDNGGFEFAYTDFGWTAVAD